MENIFFGICLFHKQTKFSCKNELSKTYLGRISDSSGFRPDFGFGRISAGFRIRPVCVVFCLIQRALDLGVFDAYSNIFYGPSPQAPLRTARSPPGPCAEPHAPGPAARHPGRAAECIGCRMHSAAACIRRPNAFRGSMHSEAVCIRRQYASRPPNASSQA